MTDNCWDCAQNETWNCQSYQEYCNWQCDVDRGIGIGGRGITYWGYHSGGKGAVIQPGNYADFTFTCTEPKCYNSPDSCNVSFYAYPNAPSSNSYVALGYGVNGVGGSNENSAYLSKVANHGAWQATELVNIPNTPYVDRGSNTFRIYNHSDVSVTIEHLKVLRIYQMCNLETEMSSDCTTTPGSSGGCSEGSSYGLSGDLDQTNQYYAGRQDYPCNIETCGGRSYTGFTFVKAGYTGNSLTTDQDGNRIIGANGGYVDIYFDFTDCSNGNYSEGDVCRFNFNPMNPASTSNNENDIKLEAYINDNIGVTPFATYYLSKQEGCGSAPSFDLMDANGYNDSGPNHVRLVNTSQVGIKMVDPAINIYRTFITSSICPPCSSCYGGQGCLFCDAWYFCPQCYYCEGCQTCDACDSCVLCEGCYGCYGCQGCQGCDSCYTCESCQTCYGCCYAWETCYACEMSCYSCETCY